MSLHEKTSWFNLVVLIIALIFYIILFTASDIIINYSTALAIFMSALLILILCNFAIIIYYRRSMDPAVSLNEPDTEIEEKKRIYPYVLYWGTFAVILIGASLWLFGLNSSLISESVNTIIILSSVSVLLFFIFFIHKFKKMMGDSFENINNYSTRDIAMQKAFIGYDERDLHIRKTSRRMALMITSGVLLNGLLIGVLWAHNHFGTFTLPINLIYIYLLIAGIMFFRHIVIQTATIIQYRMGK